MLPLIVGSFVFKHPGITDVDNYMIVALPLLLDWQVLTHELVAASSASTNQGDKGTVPPRMIRRRVTMTPPLVTNTLV